jgi:hypothetical protein
MFLVIMVTCNNAMKVKCRLSSLFVNELKVNEEIFIKMYLNYKILPPKKLDANTE